MNSKSIIPSNSSSSVICPPTRNGVASSSGGLVWIGGINSVAFAEDLQESDVFHIGGTPSSSGAIVGWGSSSTISPVSGVYYVVSGYFNSGASTLLVNYNNVGATSSDTFTSPVNIAVGAWSADVSPYAHIQWLRTRTYVSSMPTFTIGSPSVFQANASSFNTTHQHYMTFAPYEYNLSQGMYTYSIPDSFNSKYVTLYYNASWTLEYVYMP